MPAARVAIMSRTAPHFSAREIGGRSPDGAADPPAVESLKQVFFSARRVKAATRTIPAPVIGTASGYDFHAPRRIVISAANPLKPGIPIEAAEATTNANAANGSAWLRFIPERMSSSRVWVRR